MVHFSNAWCTIMAGPERACMIISTQSIKTADHKASRARKCYSYTRDHLHIPTRSPHVQASGKEVRLIPSIAYHGPTTVTLISASKIVSVHSQFKKLAALMPGCALPAQLSRVSLRQPHQDAPSGITGPGPIPRPLSNAPNCSAEVSLKRQSGLLQQGKRSRAPLVSKHGIGNVVIIAPYVSVVHIASIEVVHVAPRLPHSLRIVPHKVVVATQALGPRARPIDCGVGRLRLSRFKLDPMTGHSLKRGTLDHCHIQYCLWRSCAEADTSRLIPRFETAAVRIVTLH